MGAAWTIVAEKPELRAVVQVSGKAVGKHFDRLGVVAEEKGMRRIEHYCSQSREEAMAFLCGELGISEDDVAEIDIADEAWFDPEEGLQYVRALHELTAQDHSMTRQAREAVMRDLEDYETALARLAEGACRFHFAVDV